MSEENQVDRTLVGQASVSRATELEMRAKAAELQLEIVGNRGALYAALATAQGGYAPLKKTKNVTVRGETKSGKPFSYDFQYAPLEAVIEATRPALSENGLAVFQMLNKDGRGYTLTTTLGHSSGAELRGTVSIPDAQEIQKLGSAITYLRRYSLQCLLGVNAEDDDDGNQADGNQVQPRESKSRPQQQRRSSPTPAAPKEPTKAEQPKETKPAEPKPDPKEQAAEFVKRQGGKPQWNDSEAKWEKGDTEPPPSDDEPLPQGAEPLDLADVMTEAKDLILALGWPKAQARAFVLKMTGKPASELTLTDALMLVTELKAAKDGVK